MSSRACRAVSGRQVQAETQQFVCCLITEWWTRSGLYLSEQREGGMKGLRAPSRPRGQLTHAYTHMLACSRGSRCIPCRSLSDTPARQSSRRAARSPLSRKTSFSSLTRTPVARQVYWSCKAPLSPRSLAASLSCNANGEPLWWKPFVWKCVCLL